MGKLSAAVVGTMLDALGAQANSGTIKIYTGSAPTNVETAATGTLLATCTLGATAFASAVPVTGTGASITANSITQDSSADASGTAGYYRTLKSDGTTAIDQGTIGTSGTDMIVPSTTVTSGVPFEISSYVITQTC
ncbi:MAG TPA: hypothetical protein VLZ84_01545 [Asticcacaulis sp.]|nr:hypothetical protein [Asticcacaulis sp.]